MPATEAFLDCFQHSGRQNRRSGVGDICPSNASVVNRGSPAGEHQAIGRRRQVTISKLRAMMNVLIYFGPSLDLLFLTHSIACHSANRGIACPARSRIYTVDANRVTDVDMCGLSNIDTYLNKIISWVARVKVVDGRR